jgi:DNA-binding GntR family transcriptional regulator
METQASLSGTSSSLGKKTLLGQSVILRRSRSHHLYAAADVPRDAQRLDTQHREILAACQARDPVRAANAVRHHLQQTVAHVMKVLDQAGKT